MLLILVGKSCSGKTSLKKELVNRGWKPIITYTTRPMRDSEVNDNDYHFISVKEFEEKIEEGFFAEYKYYDTDFGRWYYGSPIAEIDKAEEIDSVIILTPDGYRDFQKMCNYTTYRCAYIYSNLRTIKLRMVERGDIKSEAERRMNKDQIDFKGVENEVDRIFYNNEKKSIEELADEIINWLKAGGRDERY